MKIISRIQVEDNDLLKKFNATGIKQDINVNSYPETAEIQINNFFEPLDSLQNNFTSESAINELGSDCRAFNVEWNTGSSVFFGGYYVESSV